MRLDNFPADAPLCASGKRPFRDAAAAQTHLELARRYRGSDADRGRRPGVVEQSYYECPTCKWWHLRSSTRAQRRNVLGNTKTGRRRRG